MKNSKLFRIFALLYRRRIYIGKTFSRRLSAVYHRHCRGNIIATACFPEKPTLHVLYSAKMQPFEAYRYILAFIHIFKNAGYEILNCSRSIERSENLHSATQAIVDTLLSTDPEVLLMDTLIKNPTDADMLPEADTDKPEEVIADQKITIRVASSEKQEYMKIGAELCLNQRETLQYLLAKAKQTDSGFLDFEGDGYLRALVNAYREENAKLKKRNAELYEKLTVSRVDKQEKLAQKNKQIEAIKNGIQQYFAMMHSICKIPVGFETGKYEDFLGVEQYQFPKEVGSYIFRPQEILRSKGRWGALFILGKGDNDKLYKFRWYPKAYYAGLQIRDHIFGKHGSVWLVGCEKANDGAMDLIYAFPLEVQFRYDGSDEYGSRLRRNVTDLLKEIESYQNS